MLKFFQTYSTENRSGKNNLANSAVVFCEPQAQETREQQRSLILSEGEGVAA